MGLRSGDFEGHGSTVMFSFPLAVHNGKHVGTHTFIPVAYSRQVTSYDHKFTSAGVGDGPTHHYTTSTESVYFEYAVVGKTFVATSVHTLSPITPV